MKRQEINRRIGERANLFMREAKDDRELTQEERDRTEKKRAEISEWVKNQEWYRNKKRV